MDRLLKPDEAGALIGVSARTLAGWRVSGISEFSQGSALTNSTNSRDNVVRWTLMQRVRRTVKDQRQAGIFADDFALIPIVRTRETDSQSTIGTIAELVASADLMNRGFEVFRALSPNASCDLIAKRGAASLRIEVKATVVVSGKVRSRSANRSAPVDHVALVIRNGQVFYKPELPRAQIEGQGK